jgi:hypothetical protein
MAVQRRQGGAASPPVPAVLGDGPGLLQGYPDLYDFLVLGRWPDGCVRETGTAMVFLDDGKWKIWLHDRDAKAGCFVAGNSLEGALQAAEGAVSGQSGDWRPDKKRTSRGA